MALTADFGLDTVAARALGLKMPTLDLVVIGWVLVADVEVINGIGSSMGDRGLGATSGEVFTPVGIGSAMIGLGVEDSTEVGKAEDSVELGAGEGDGTGMKEVN